MIYLVRICETREFVGVFSAGTTENLFWLVDQCTDPYACEVCPLPSEGGIYASGKASSVGSDDDEDLEAHGLCFTASWAAPQGAWRVFESKTKLRRAA